MKIAAFVPFDEESICYGLIDGENIREINDPFTGEEIKESGKVYKRADVILVNPTFPVKVLCIGLNYRDHAEELCKSDDNFRRIYKRLYPTSVI